MTPDGIQMLLPPETIGPDLQHASNDISLVRPNLPHIAD
jgi:hypothetical protein